MESGRFVIWCRFGQRVFAGRSHLCALPRRIGLMHVGQSIFKCNGEFTMASFRRVRHSWGVFQSAILPP